MGFKNNLPLFAALVLLPLLRSSHGQSLNFTNPIFDGKSADPAILRLGSHYYLTLSENNERELTIFKSNILTNFRNSEKKIAYEVEEGYHDLWASEMHLVDGELYIYFTMQHPENSGMHVIKADNASNPMGGWSRPHRISDGIDGTIMRHNGQKYFVNVLGVEGRPFPGLGIWIAPMLNATHLNGSYELLKPPVLDWECNDGCLCEGPYFIYHKNKSFMVYSGSGTWDPNYALSWMSIPQGKDPMIVENWYWEHGPVFWKNDEEDVYQTGHAAFTTSPDGEETWMVYHGTQWDSRDIRVARIEKIEWDQVTGNPIFPRPHGYEHWQRVPSGQTEV